MTKILLLAAVLLAQSASAQDPGRAGEPWDGLTVFQPLSSTTAYLIELDGTVVETWPGSYRPGNAVYLRENGNLLRTIHVAGTVGGSGGGVQEVDWNGSMVWDYRYSTTSYLQHHDVEEMPNGNVLMIAWEYIPRAEAIAAGRNPAYIQGTTFAPDHVIEVQATGPTSGTIVWEWHLWDHLIQDFDPSKANYGNVADHPELMDLNYPPKVPQQGDWNHLNSIDFNPELDQIVLSSHNQDEIWVIDHSTTTAEAAGHTGGNSGMGGDLLYRWGNPEAYRAGSSADQMLFGQHDAQWIEPGCPGEGNILVYNNGAGRPAGPYSSVEEIVPPVDAQGHYSHTPGTAFGPAQPTWIYTAPDPFDFYSSNISGAERLPNGNTLVCCGAAGWFFEVTQAKEKVWEYTNPYGGGMGGKGVFKIRRYRPCLEPVTYCLTAPNSSGPGALIGWTGSPSLSANDLVLTATEAATSVPGIFFFGSQKAQVPFGDGYRCAGGAILRLPVVQTDGQGNVAYALDFTDPSLNTSHVQEWDTWHFQFWFRDNAFGGAGFNFSDALEATFCE